MTAIGLAHANPRNSRRLFECLEAHFPTKPLQLVLLYEARELEGPELKGDPEGYVPFDELRSALVHRSAQLSQRVRKLQDNDLVDVIALRHRKNVPASVRKSRHGNSAFVRITAKGRKKILPVWARYKKLAEELLGDLPLEIREAHLKVNEHISNKLRATRDEPGTGFEDPEP